ncbi:MAG: ammonium transporter, partial [Alphaproteobacteria bacterium]|nr:ammonium transporter [Alphaproteobacteria bacterium]
MQLAKILTRAAGAPVGFLFVAFAAASVSTFAAGAAWAADKPAIDHGDTAWMLASTALVLMMTIPGVALFYGGMVRKMNVLATVMQSFAITCLVS